MSPHEFDQTLASMRNTLPLIWRSLYSGAVAAGFEPADAFALLQTWILSQGQNGIRIGGYPGTKPDTD